MSLDLTKPLQTRDGHSVRILCTDAHCASGGEAQPIVGVVSGHHCPMAWCLDGRYYGNETEPSDLDLVNVPPPKKKANVEVRLYLVGGEVRAWACSDADGDRWHPCLNGREIIGSTHIEMEYRP